MTHDQRRQPADHRPGRQHHAGDGLAPGASEQGVLPESLTLGQRTLEDTFLELTGGSWRHEPPSPRSPGAAPLARQVLAQAAMESRLMLRNGEQLLLAVVIPVIVLDRRGHGGRPPRPRPLAPAGRRVHPRRAGARGDVHGVHVAGDRDRVRAALRRDQAARVLAAAAVRAAARQGRRAAPRRGAADRGDLARSRCARLAAARRRCSRRC